jgi:hypothetical protein
MQVRLDPLHPGDVPRCIDDRLGLRIRGHVSVEEYLMTLDQHVDVRDVESVLKRTQHGADPVSKNIVAHSRVGVTTRDSVPQAHKAPALIASPSRDCSCQLARKTPSDHGLEHRNPRCQGHEPQRTGNTLTIHAVASPRTIEIL